ncbi:MAG: hypothetical protein K8S87_01720 [Planctomycetes bacterium]|nr:hypothetical protein [Planctomycetota bacterium]
MKFQANVESLTVLVGEGRYCRFINGLYETDDAEEIKALQRAKGVQQINEKSAPSGNAAKNTVTKNDSENISPKKRASRVSKPGKSGSPRRKKKKQQEQFMETYTIKGTGGQHSSCWKLSGYSRENTDGGRLFCSIYKDLPEYKVEIYKSANKESGSLVASGAIAAVSGEVVLDEENSSGLSGTMMLDYLLDTEFEIIVFYACYEDMRGFERNLADLLDDNGQIDGSPRFETFIEHSKRILDAHLAVRFSRSTYSNPPGREQLSSPDILREPTIYATLSALYFYLKADFNDSNFKLALDYQKKLENWLATKPVVFSRDGVEIVLEAGAVYVRRA